jgi:superkiller protein 3
LATLVFQTGNAVAARAVLEGRNADVDEQRFALALRAIAEVDIGNAQNAAAMAQRAVMLAPWDKKKWEALAYVRSRTALG